jgi:hypothetical protein
MPYLIATLVGLLLISCGAVFCVSTRRSLARYARNSVEAEAPEHFPAADFTHRLEHDESLEGLGMELPRQSIWRVALADFLVRFRCVWIIVVLGLCVAVATLFA